MSNPRARSARTIHAAAILNAYLPIIASPHDPNVCQRGHPRATCWSTNGKGRCLACARLQERIRYMMTTATYNRRHEKMTREQELAYLEERQQRDMVYGHREYGQPHTVRLTPAITGEERPKW